MLVRAMPEAALHNPSTGAPSLDAALDGLYWGDNVVWEYGDGAGVTGFYGALAQRAGEYDYAAYVTLETPPSDVAARYPGLHTIDARPGGPCASPQALLEAVRSRCRGGRRNLLLLDSIGLMSERWGSAATSGFFTRCCPMLLEVGAIAYWSLPRSAELDRVRRDVEDVTQCVLVLREGRLRIAKAEGRPAGVQGSVWHYRSGDPPELEQAPAAARLGAALRAVRMQRQLSQAALAQMAGVSASAISQSERGQRGLSLETLLELTGRLHITVDELLRGEVSAGYRLGRRDDPALTPTGRPAPLLDDPEAGMRAYLVRLAAGASSAPQIAHKGTELVAVVAGLVQVVLSSGRPVLRAGEVLLADRSSIVEWRNIGQRPAALFWIIRD
jgi:transcriptional regulator with XRE-family HTH domain